MKYYGWKGDKIDAYYQHYHNGEWVRVSFWKYWFWLTPNRYIRRKEQP